jgi:hypothetical protein
MSRLFLFKTEKKLVKTNFEKDFFYIYPHQINPITMNRTKSTFHFIEPFVPSGKDFDLSKALFLELGFQINWEASDYVGFQKDSCRFILQRFDNQAFAENLMLRLAVDDLDAFWEEMSLKKLDQKFGVKWQKPTRFPYGREAILIDIAGVCWHFAEE